MLPELNGFTIFPAVWS